MMEPTIEQSSVVLILPTHWECRPILRLFENKVRETKWKVPAWRFGKLLILQSGMGPANASKLIPIIEQSEPQQIWLCGWCGGLTPEFKCGALVLSDQTVHSDGRIVKHPAKPMLMKRLSEIAADVDKQLRIGAVLTTERVLYDSAEKPASDKFIAVEMEAGPLAEWAAINETEFVHLRVVLDPLESSLPGGGPLRMLRIAKQIKWTYDFFKHARQANKVMTSTIARLLRAGYIVDETTE